MNCDSQTLQGRRVSTSHPYLDMDLQIFNTFVTIRFLRKFIIYTFHAWYVNKYSMDLNILVRENKYNLKSLYIIKNMFSSRIIENSNRNQVTGYELTFPLRVQVNFLGMGWPGYGSVRVRVD